MSRAYDNAADARLQQGGRRNLIINGAMQVAQRGDTSGITSSSYGGPDRYELAIASAGTWTMSQSSTAPTGFASSLKLDCTASTGSPTILTLFQKFEGQNLQHLKKGTADAESLTLSFWIRSNKTGNIQVNFTDVDNDRMISSVVTISSANTFEHKTITVDGDTTGSLNNDNTSAFSIEWFLDGSSTYTSGATPTAWETKANADRGAGTTIALADSTANELYITGVQLEVGNVATPFEHRSYGEELALCQRYYTEFGNHTVFAGRAYGSADLLISAVCPVPLRASPTVGGSGDMSVYGASVTDAVAMSAVGVFQFTANTNKVALDINTYSGLTDNRVANTGITNSGTLTLDAEL